MTRYKDEIHDIGVAACTQLFESYGVILAKEDEPVAARGELHYCGIITLTGENIRGTLGLASAPALLGRSDPTKVGSRDWVGELANQLAGRVKRRLLARSVEINYSTPVVLRGEQLRLTDTSPVKTLWFRSEDDNQICLWLDVELADQFEMAREDDDELGGLPEGDFLLF